MTRLVRALEARGLVVRESDERDGRVVRIRATAKGRTLMAEGRARRVRTLARELERLGAEELAALRGGAAAIERIAERLRAAD
jgi:DNA-binding MarR family transcriptional regulator